MINAISMLYLFNINPKDIQIVFIDGLKINFKLDPFYEIYKNIISIGGAPLYISDLKKKYHISFAIYVPFNGDSTSFLSRTNELTKTRLDCKNPSKTYKIYQNLIDKYMKISKFYDKFISDNEIFYYPKLVILNNNLNITFDKKITIQWRKIWPKGRTNQKRILGNGPELAERLSYILPKNILIRLVDTAGLNIREQISIMRNTDYLLGIHGAGLSLSIFLPNKSIVHEILHKKNINVLSIMSSLSGHKTYSDIIKSKVKIINDNEIIFFNVDDFAKIVLNRMKECNFI